MTDPIDKLIELAKELPDGCFGNITLRDGEWVLFLDVANALRSALPDLERMREESRWRYVEVDGLPEVGENWEQFNVCRNVFNGSLPNDGISTTALFHNGKWYTEEFERTDGVYAYRTLPEKAPQGGEQ